MSVTTRAGPSFEDQHAEVEAILNSGIMAPGSRPGRLLEYLFQKSCRGEEGELKESTIAVELLGKPPTFDPHADASVRVEAHRLRKKLQQYYEQHGSQTGFKVVVPVGQYVVHFEATPTATPFNDAPRTEAAAYLGPAGWRTVARIVAAGLLLAGIFALVRFERIRTRSAAAAPGFRTGIGAADPEPDAVRILAGYSGEDRVDAGGRRWAADRFYEGGIARPVAKRMAEWSGRPEIFEWAREGNARYRIPLAPGAYELRLYFAETESPATMERTPQRFRILGVEANGRRILPAYDLDAETGFAPDIRSFANIEVGGEKLLDLRFLPIRGRPVVSAIEVLPMTGGKVRPLRVSARSTPYVDGQGRYWSPDDYFRGGSTAADQSMVAGARDPGFCPAERYGDFEYSIPAADGEYRVSLYFAEAWFGPGQYGQGAVGSRVFDVFLNHEPVLKNFDLLAAAPPNRLVTRTFEHVRPNARGKIRLDFVSRVNYATLRALEVIPE